MIQSIFSALRVASLLIFAAIVAPSAANAQLTLGVQLDQSGGNDPLISTASRNWNFEISAVAPPLTFAFGDFEMKYTGKEGNSTAPVVFTIYSGLGGANNPAAVVLGTVTMQAGAFTNQYKPKIFSLKPVSLSAGFYSFSLTTTASKGEGYFLKQSKGVSFVDSKGAAVDSRYVRADLSEGGSAGLTFNGPTFPTGSGGTAGNGGLPPVVVVPVPEPATALSAVALCLTVALRRNRRRAV